MPRQTDPGRQRANAPKALSRDGLEKKHGRVRDTRELAAEYVITAITGDRLIVRRRSDGVVGHISFQNAPRYDFDFQPSPAGEEGPQA